MRKIDKKLDYETIVKHINDCLGDAPFHPIGRMVDLGLVKSPTAIFAMVRRGELEVIKICGRYLVTKEELCRVIYRGIIKKTQED